MESAGFLRTAKIGGFEKSDVLAYIDELNSKICALENDVKEANERSSGAGQSDDARVKKLEQDVKGLNEQLTSANKKLKQSEENLANEKLSRQNDKMGFETEKQKISKGGDSALSGQIREKDSQIRKKDEEIKDLKQKVDMLKNEVEELKENGSDAGASSTFDIGSVFIEAQNTAKRITTEAKSAADKMTREAKIKSETLISEATRTAEKIIDDANRKSRNTMLDVNEKSDMIDGMADTVKTIMKDQLTDLLTSVNNISDTVLKMTSDMKLSFDNTRKVINQTTIRIDDDKKLKELVSSLPKYEVPDTIVKTATPEPKSSAPANKAKLDDIANLAKQIDGGSSNSKWSGMDDLKALTKKIGEDINDKGGANYYDSNYKING